MERRWRLEGCTETGGKCFDSGGCEVTFIRQKHEQGNYFKPYYIYSNKMKKY